NQAYQKLKNRDQLRETMLEQFLDGKGSKEASPQPSGLTTSGLPGDLAEEWFELQEQIIEAPQEARVGAQEFQTRVEERINRLEAQIGEYENQFDDSQSRTFL